MVILFLLAGWGSYAQDLPAGTLSLRQCIETAIANNRDVRQGDLQVQEDRLNWKQSKLNMLPDLNGILNHQLNTGRSIDPFTNGYINQNYSSAAYSINSGVILFNGFSIQNGIKQNSLAYEASKMDGQQIKDNLTINVILAYLQVLSNRDLVAQAAEQVELSKKQVERLELLNRDGAIPPSQLSDLRGQFAGDRLAYLNAEKAWESSKIYLFQLMNLPYGSDRSFENIETSSFAASYPDTPDKIYATALEKFALARSVDLRKESAEKAVKVFQGQLFPTLSLNGNLSSNYSSAATKALFLNSTDVTSDDYVVVNGNSVPVIRKQNNYNYQKIKYGSQLDNNLFTSVSLNLRIPIFNAGSARNRVKMARIRLESTDIAAKTTKIQLQQSIEQAYLNMTTAFQSYKTLLEQVTAYQESFRAAEIRFNEGVGNTIDYLTAKTNLDRANINLINAKYDYVLRIRILDFYQGKPLW